MSRIREKLSAYGRRLVEKNLVTGPGGNISAREGDTVYLSPSGFNLAEIGEDQWFALDLASGEPAAPVPGGLRPTCEATIHLACYLADPAIGAVIHTHPVLATALASAGMEFRAPFPDFAVLVGPRAPIIDYLMPGSPQFRDAVMEQFKKGEKALLVKNHGAITVGSSLEEALARTLALEECARFIEAAFSVSGMVPFLGTKQVRELRECEFEDYRKMILEKGPGRRPGDGGEKAA